MTGHPSAHIILGLAAVQVLGLGSAWAARLSEGSRSQTSCHLAFFACLVVVGITSIAALGLGPGCWISSSTTFSVMVLAATCDFQRQEQGGGQESSSSFQV